MTTLATVATVATAATAINWTAIVASTIAASATLVTAFVTLFLAERYKRYHEASAIAAGLAGELSSYTEAIPLMRNAIDAWVTQISLDYQSQLMLRPMEKPTDRFFEEVVGKVGVLGPELAEVVIYTYSNLNAFRGALVVIFDNHRDMSQAELLSRLQLCGVAMERAAKGMTTAIPLLKTRSQQRFRVLSLS